MRGLHLALLLLCLALAGHAATIYVSSVPALQAAVDAAAAGDILVLADGTYTNTSLSIATDNIVVTAATPGGVYLNGTQHIGISGDHVTFTGFQFTSGDIGAAFLIEVSGSYNLLSQLNLNGYLAQKYIRIEGGTVSNEIAYCNIENKPTNAVINTTIQITTSPTVPGYHKIRYCSFKNFPGLGGDYGNEPIRIGLSTEATNISRTTVEHCYFTNCGLGDSESISVKSSENLCRYNTFSGNPNAMLVLRHGFRNVVYGNFFINNSGGVRIKEGNTHYVYNNYFATGAQDALTLQYVVDSPLTNINLVHNTFVEPGPIDLGGSGIGGVTFANNIFKKSSGSIFSNPNDGTAWAGNIYLGTLGITKPATGLTNTDPKLVLNPDGYWGLASNSPAINAASAAYPATLDIPGLDDDPNLLLDVSGQARPATVTLKDVGCDEFTNGPTSNRPLTLADVGPSYLGGPGATPPVITAQPQGRTVSIGVGVIFSVSATGTLPLSYQWRRNGANISGATSPSYSLSSAQLTNGGDYTVVLTNVAGSVTSAVATLIVSEGAASIILDDRWRDGTRTNTSLPTDAAWFASTAATLAPVTNTLNGIPDPAATRTWWTYFTAEPALPVSLNVGETLRVSLAFTATGINGSNSSRGIRLGLYNSSSAARTLADGANPNGTGCSGYMFSFNLGQILGGSGTMQFMERTNLPSSNLIGTVNDYFELSQGGPAAGGPGFSNGVPCSLVWQVKRATNYLDLSVTIADTNGWSMAYTAKATNNLTTAFDTFVFRPALQAQTATNFAFTQLKVEKVTPLANVPLVISQFGMGAGGVFAISGTGPAGAPYRVLVTTNLALAFSEWTLLAGGTLVGGSFGCSDALTTNLPQKFYRVVSP